MALGRTRTLLLKIAGDGTDAVREVDKVERKVSALDRVKAEALVDIQTRGANVKLGQLNSRLERLDKQEVTPQVEIARARVARQIDSVQRDLDRLDRRKVKVDVDVDRDGTSGLRGRAGISGRGNLFGSVAAGLGPGGAAAIGATAGSLFALKSFGEAAIESEQSGARLQTQLAALDISFDKNRDKIDAVIQRHSRLAGLDDEDLQDAFTNIVRISGDVDESLNLVGLAADFARAKQIDVGTASNVVAKVAGGNIGILGRYGIQIDKNATSSEALAELQRRFAGQAESYGRTTGGAFDRMGVAAENLRETLGTALAPAFKKAADFAGDLIGEIDKIARRKDIDLGEKIKLSAELVRDKLRPVAAEVGRAIRRAHLGERLTAAIEAAAPVIAKAAGRAAAAAARGFFRAWRDSPVWVKLLTAAFVAAKVVNVFGPLGAAASALFARRFRRHIAGESFAAGARPAGLAWGSAFGVAAGITALGLVSNELGKLADKEGVGGRGGASLGGPNSATRGGIATGKKIAEDPKGAVRKAWDLIKGAATGGLGHQSGGLIPGAGSGDIVPAMLEPGEFVVRKSVVRALGPRFMGALNAGAASPVAALAGGGRGGTHIEHLDAHFKVVGGGMPDWRAGARAMADELKRRG